MTRYSVQPRDRIFVKGYGFLPFAKSMSKTIGENISKDLSGKYSPGILAMHKDFLIMLNKLQQMRLKLLQKKQLKKAEATGHLICNKITKKISKNSQRNNSEIVTNEHDREIPKETYISPEERKKLLMSWD